MKSSVATTKQVQGTLLSRSLEDFLDSSDSESGGTFACDEGSDDDDNDPNAETNVGDTKQRPTLVGVIKRSVNPRGVMQKQGSMRGLLTKQGRQASVRSLFRKNVGGGGYQEELHSDNSDSDDKDAVPGNKNDTNKVRGKSQVPNRRDRMKESQQPGYQGSSKPSLFRSANEHEEDRNRRNGDSGDGTGGRDMDECKRTNRSTNHHDRQPNRRKSLSSSRSKDFLGLRSCHGIYRSKSDDVLQSFRSMHIPKRTLTTHTSAPGEISVMASAMFIEPDKKTMKKSCSATVRAHQKQRRRSASDPENLDETGSRSLQRSNREKRRNHHRSDSSNRNTSQKTDNHHDRCDQSLSSDGLLSDLSLSLHSVGEFEDIPKQNAPTHRGEERSSSFRVPISISIDSDISQDLESKCTALTDCDLSGFDDEEIDPMLHKCSTDSKSSRKTFQKRNPHDKAGQKKTTRKDSRRVSERHHHGDDHTDAETVKSAVTLPGQMPASKSVKNDSSIARPLRRRLTNSHNDEKTDDGICTFDIDVGQPLVRCKHRGTSEFVELNISCHDTESVASLTRINARA